MIKINKATQTTFKAKDIVIFNNSFIDAETGEIIPVIETLDELFGDEPFELTAVKKFTEDISSEE